MVDEKKEELMKEAIADVVLQIFQLCGMLSLNLPFLKQTHDVLEKNLSGYEALGIIEGNVYFDKCKRNRAELDRMDALINLVEVLMETNSFVDVEPGNVSKLVGEWRD